MEATYKWISKGLLTYMRDLLFINSENKILYISKYADYLLNQKCRDQVTAFVEGLQTVIGPDMLNYFYPDELQILISGGMNEIDIDDLRRNTIYH